MTSPSLRPAAAPEVPLRRIAEVVAAHRRDATTAGDLSAAEAGIVVGGVTLDSRQVLPGDLYAALPGAKVHGARFADQAAAAGAAAIFTDDEGARLIAQAGPPATGLPRLTMAQPRALLGEVAATVYGDPTTALMLLGVTGTNGKTTVAYLLEAGLRAAGHRTGLIGTVQTRIADDVVPSVRTTPEAPELQALFATMRERRVSAAAMEVSSHALALHRVDGSRFSGAAFTNLSQDHLDFHTSLEEYFEAKALLFDASRGLLPEEARAVVAADDPYGMRLADRRRDAVTFGLGPHADWRATDVRCDAGGSTFTVLAPDGQGTSSARVQLPGAFNVRNALCAIALLTETGTPLAAAIEGVAGLTGVPGRMERIDAGQPFLALVDYAHTPDAVAGLLETVRELVTGRVLLVLGCGGDRDRGKRPLMGAAGVRGSDLAILTSDNPRSEDPLEILTQMQAGATEAAQAVAGSAAQIVLEPDRAAAIALAVASARTGDAVVIAGKGHETGQEIAGVVHPFDDRQVLRTALVAAAETA